MQQTDPDSVGQAALHSEIEQQEKAIPPLTRNQVREVPVEGRDSFGVQVFVRSSRRKAGHCGRPGSAGTSISCLPFRQHARRIGLPGRPPAVQMASRPSPDRRPPAKTVVLPPPGTADLSRVGAGGDHQGGVPNAHNALSQRWRVICHKKHSTTTGAVCATDEQPRDLSMVARLPSLTSTLRWGTLLEATSIVSSNGCRRVQPPRARPTVPEVRLGRRGAQA